MKKVLAILFALILVLSFAACGKDSDKDDAATPTTVAAPAGTNTAVVVPQQTQAQDTQVVVPQQTQAQVVTPVTPSTGTLEAWVAANQTALNTLVNEYLVEDFAEGFLGTYGDSFDGSFSGTVSATGNKLVISIVISGLDVTDEILEQLSAYSYETQSYVDAMTDAEKAELFAAFAESMTEFGLTGAPTPDGMAMYIYSDTGIILYAVDY